MYNRKSYPTAIAHLDCNAFFASVEQAYNPFLLNKPVAVAGLGGGCVITASYEARKYQIKTGTTVWEAKKLCPNIIIIPANFKRYLIYNQNLLQIVKSFTPEVEEASIDECYFNLTGLRRLYRKPYPAICQEIKETIKNKLGITVSIGLSTSKVLAKTASNYRKPDGLTVINGKYIEDFLAQIKLKDIKGIGFNTLSLLNKQGIYTPIEFTKANPNFIKSLLGKSGTELQMELQGKSVNSIKTTVNPPKSLARTRSFKKTNNQQIIYQELIKNTSLAFWHLRKKKLKTKQISIMLRAENYQTYYQEIPLFEDINSEIKILPAIKKAFETIFQSNLTYRSTGLTTSQLTPEQQVQPQLLPSVLEDQTQINLFEKIDQLNHKYGTHSVAFGQTYQYYQARDPFQKLYLPYLGIAK